MTDLRTGNYGQDYRYGVLAEHTLHSLGHLHVTASGRQVFVTNEGESIPVLCGEIVWIYTEDGRIDGRCGNDVRGTDDACPGHQAQLDSWRNASEIERAAIERREDAEGSYA